jgi:hypothetical protein
MTKRIFILALFLFFHLGQSQSLRPNHWSDEYIDFLQGRGYLWNLSALQRPFDIQDLKHELKGELVSPTQASAVAYERSLYLHSFLQEQGRDAESVCIGVQTDNRYSDDHLVKTYHGVQRLQVSARLKPWLELANTMTADSRLDNDPGYMGISQNGFAGYTEQAYLRLHKDGVELKIGRDYLRWGPGLDASLLISDQVRPLDQLLFSWRNRYLHYTFFFSSLDAVSADGAQGSVRRYRYLSGHRLEVRPWRFLSLAVQEAILYGAEGGGLNLAFWNPFIFFHAEQLNGPDDGNTLGSIQAVFKPQRNWRLYGDLLIDDLQLENSGPTDLEPSERGYLLGVNWSDPFWMSGVDLFGEYAAVTNRTYNSLNVWEKWLHRRQPLGHFLGNDFDRLILGLRWWPASAWRGRFFFEHRNRGEGRIEKTFDEPWLTGPVGKEYHESFPTGVVESSNRLTLELSWQPRWWLRVFGLFDHTAASNWQNRKGVAQSFWQGQIGFSVEAYKSILLK